MNYWDILGNFKGVGRVVERPLDKGRNTQDKSEFGSKMRSTRRTKVNSGAKMV